MTGTAITYTWRGDVDNVEMNRLHADAFETRVFDGTEWNWKEQLRRPPGSRTRWWPPTHATRGSATDSWRSRSRKRAARCEWLHDSDEPLRALYLDACGFSPTNAGLIAL